MLTSATEHYQRQQRIGALGVLAARRAWESGNFVALFGSVALFQKAAARDAADSVPLMLAEQNIDADPVSTVNVAALAGVASDGRPLASLIELAGSESQLSLMVVTQIQDAARTAAGMATVVRPKVQGYTRMMVPPSCSRCAVLAGQWFKWNQGFQRHPRCDCRHIPSSEAHYGDATLSGDKWFHTLSSAEQDRIFTKAGAEAVRNGADLTQVVNARRGMETAGLTRTRVNADGLTVNVNLRSMASTQIGGRDVYLTREGITRRGIYGSSDAAIARGFDARHVGRRGFIKNSVERTTKRPRLMPETIFAVATDRADAIRLLTANGYIF